MKKALITVLFFLCLAVMLYSGYQLYTIYSDYGQAEHAYEDVVNQFVTPADRDVLDAPEDMTAPDRESQPGETAPTEPEAEPLVPISVDFDALLAVNKNVIGWIYCPDTTINYPIVQTGNNSDYLRRLLDGSYNRSGTLFMDYRNPSDLTGYNSIIYGHNMGSGKMFAPLMNYRKQSYYDGHPVMYLLTPEGNYRLDVLGGAVVDPSSDYYIIRHTQDSFDKFLTKIVRNSDFQSTVDPDTVTRTVTLSTCTNWQDDSRYILVCALTPIVEEEAAG